MDGYLTTQLLYVAAKLGIADLVAEEPRTPEELAEAVGIDAAPLRRVLRGLAVEDVLTEGADGRFALTAVGAGLRDGVPGSLRGAIIARGELYWGAAGGLLDALREGETAFARVHGEPFFDHLARDRARAAVYQASLAGRSEREAADVVAAYDFAHLGWLVDVGGGSGALLAAILRAAPGLRATLVERPAAMAAARERLAAAGVQDRAELVEGDFFTALPHGADAYLLSRVLHNWDDDDARRILAVSRTAMADDARLLLVEAVMPEHATALPAAIRMDLHMLILFGARERTAAEYRALLAEAGFAVVEIHPTRSPVGLAVIEAAFWR